MRFLGRAPGLIHTHEVIGGCQRLNVAPRDKGYRPAVFLLPDSVPGIIIFRDDTGPGIEPGSDLYAS